MPQFHIELKKSGCEVLHILLFVLWDDCGDGVEISEGLASLLANRRNPLVRYVAKLLLTMS
jgi:hypothetical protein